MNAGMLQQQQQQSQNQQQESKPNHPNKGVVRISSFNKITITIVLIIMTILTSSSHKVAAALVSRTTGTRAITFDVARRCFGASRTVVPSSSSLFAYDNPNRKMITTTTRFMSSSSQSSAAAASTSDGEEEDDIDTALDKLLGLPPRPKSSNGGSSNGASLPSTPSMPWDGASLPSTRSWDSSERPSNGVRATATPAPTSAYVGQSDVDFHDTNILSTSNPRWRKAGIPQEILDILSNKGITHLTPVQAEAFEPVMNRYDIIGRSRTGTGKTIAFGMPSLLRLVSFTESIGVRDPSSGRMQRGRSPSMIVLCPTRELSKQVQEEIAMIATPLGLFVDVVHGGVSFGPQERSLRDGIDVLVGTPGRIIDHLERGNLNLKTCDVVVLDEADEMLNMGFADDVETILKGVGKDNPSKTQFLLFSATTPSWVKNIGRKYQSPNVVAIDSTTEEGGARVAKTVRHIAIQVPPGDDSKYAILEDLIAVEISKDLIDADQAAAPATEELHFNPIAAAAAAKKKNATHAIQQKIFGKTIVFTQTKRQADELVSGSVFKALSAQALHGDVGQKQRDSTLAAFRAGSFNVLVATDVAARGIDIQNVDLVIQFDPPRDVDTYVHRSGRTGRAGKKGVSVLLYNKQQQRDIVRIERDLGHGFKFHLTGPPSVETAIHAVAKTSAIATKSIPESTTKYFYDAAAMLLNEMVTSKKEGVSDEDDTSVEVSAIDPVIVVARCLAAISRRSTEAHTLSRSLLTGNTGYITLEMTNTRGRDIGANDVMFTVGKLSRMSKENPTAFVGSDGSKNITFGSDIGKIQVDQQSRRIFFDMDVTDAPKLIEFAKNVDAGGCVFSIVDAIEIQMDRDDYYGGGGGSSSRGGGGRNGNQRSYGGGGGGRSYGGGGGSSYSNDRPPRGRSPYNDHSHTGSSNRGGGGSYGGGGRDRNGGRDSYGGSSGAGRYGNGGSSRGGGGGW